MMIIEIRKAGFVNKGAALMLHAAHQMLSKRYPNADFTIPPSRKNGNFPYSEFSKMGFFPKAWMYRKGMQLGNMAVFLPKSIREMYGIVLDREVDVVIDAAGFEYSDQWGPRSAIELAKSSAVWRKNNKKIILLPQALGPFENAEIKKAMHEIVRNVDLIMPRDDVSYKYLVDLVGQRKNIKQYPDFTNLVDIPVVTGYEKYENRFCIIPNCRMLDKTKGQVGSKYVEFFRAIVAYLVSHGENPFIMVHEGLGDLKLAKDILEPFPNIEILTVSEPLVIKAVIKTTKATIGSRFHGLVSALSQNVPSLAAGWSHKYEMLFNDYDFPEGILKVDGKLDDLYKKLDLLLNDESRIVLKDRIAIKSKVLKQKTSEMWETVFNVIDAS